MQTDCVKLSYDVSSNLFDKQEQIRLEELQKTGILDSSPEDINFDRLTSLASRFFKV